MVYYLSHEFLNLNVLFSCQLHGYEAELFSSLTEE